MTLSNLTERVKAKLAKTPAKVTPSSSSAERSGQRPGPGRSKGRKKRRHLVDDGLAGEKPPAPPPPAPDTVEAYYEILKPGFYMKNAEGEYQRMEKDTFKLELRSRGYFKGHRFENGLSYLETELLRLTKERSVHYAGPLGGYTPGRYDIGHTRVLVTTGPKFIDRKQGEWPFLRAFLTQLLGEQGRYFCAWLKLAFHALKRGAPWAIGQMLAVAGQGGCGKSLLQSLITPMLGGRVSRPFAYLSGKSDFNAHIFEAEHALIGDEVPHNDFKLRRAFGAAVKNLVAEKDQAMHPKGKQEITLTPFLRVTMTLNDNPESLLVLPPLDGDIKDKIMLLKANPVKFPFPTKRFPDSKAYFEQLVRELPHFLYYLNRWNLPESIRDQRYGVISYKDPGLVHSVDQLAPEWKLWYYIERFVFSSDFPGEWCGTANDLETLLKERDKTGEVKGLLWYNTACGQFLSKLEDKHPDRVKSRIGGKNVRFYTLTKD